MSSIQIKQVAKFKVSIPYSGIKSIHLSNQTLFLSAANCVQLWNLNQSDPILLTSIGVASTPTSVVASAEQLILITEGQVKYAKLPTALCQMKLPAKVAFHLNRFGVKQPPLIFYSLIYRIPTVLNKQYKTEYADVSTDKVIYFIQFFQPFKTEYRIPTFISATSTLMLFTISYFDCSWFGHNTIDNQYAI